MSSDTIKINVPILARVEGEGALDLTIDNQKITYLQLRIYEPPRYFEKFLEGRNYYDVPDTVARICGICPVAYQMSASHAIESIFNIETTPWIRTMRRLFYCGEWLQSHSLHVHLLAAPDFLGFGNAIEMAAKYPAEVRRGLKLQTLGNDLVALFGARSVHPVGVRIGGFSHAPSVKQVNELLQRVVEAKQDAIDLIKWLDTLELPDDQQEFISVALHHDDEFAFNEGRLVSDNGLDIAISDFENHFKETHVDHSTALHCLLDGKPYLVGPLARINVNKNQLPDEVKLLMQELTTQFPSKNMFHSMLARAIEIYFSLVEAENILSCYELTDQPCIPVEPQAGTGFGCTEAPRGFLWHRYNMDDKGCVSKAVIVPPTSQNQPRIEQDLHNSLVNFGLDNSKQALQLHAEKVIRNYDPCISCATHFLDLNLVRNGVNELTAETENRLPDFKLADPGSTAILCIGSPNQQDEFAWQLYEQLMHREEIETLRQKGLQLYRLDRPGVQIINYLEKYQHVLLIDSVKPGQTEDSLVIIDAGKLDSASSALSVHATGVVDSLVLSGQLGKLPGQLVIAGVSRYSTKLVDQILSMF